MKRLIFCSMVLLNICCAANAQSNVSQPKSFNISRQIIPPILDVVENSLKFVDEDRNNFINANERCKICFKLKNSGKGEGKNCIAKISATGATQGLTYNNKRLPIILPNQTIDVEIPIEASMNTQTGGVKFVVEIEEPNDCGTSVEITVDVKAFENPYVEMVSYKIEGDGGLLAKRKPFRLQVMVQNTGYGLAEDVNVDILFPNKNVSVFCTSANEHSNYSKLKSNEKQIIDYEFLVNNKYTSDNLDVTVNITEKYGRFSKNATINLKFGQSVGSPQVLAVTGIEEQRKTITKGSFFSDVDENIPVSRTSNEETFVVIIGNEDYKSVSIVPYALNDSKIFKDYCELTLGIPSEHIRYEPDATLNQLRKQISWLKDVIDVNSDAKIIFYYAGHGIPDESNRSAYLLPIDGDGSDVSTGYELDRLFSELGEKPCKQVTIFLDACFSGAKREGDMLVAARGVAVRTKSGSPKGNMVVFSASQGDETATAYDEKQHGMFTYYLLKKLQETQGDVTYGILSDYIKTNVERQSVVVKGKRQTPSTLPSSTIIGDWKMWKLK